MKMNKIIIASAIVLFTMNVNAQEKTKEVETNETQVQKVDRKAQMAKMKEQRAAMKVAYITKELNLTEEEAEDFWPINNKMEEELKALKKANKPADKSKKIEDLTEVEVEDIMQKAFTTKEKEIEVRRAYHEEFKKVLGVKRTAKFYHVEKSAGKKGIQQMMQRRSGEGSKMKQRSNGRPEGK